MNTSRHKYTWSKLWGSVHHEWSLAGSLLAISFHVSVHSEHGDTAGLEVHYYDAPEYMKDKPPSHVDCIHTGGRCWHDGTSLYAMETLWPMIKHLCLTGDHETIFRIMEGEVDRRQKDEMEAVNANS